MDVRGKCTREKRERKREQKQTNKQKEWKEKKTKTNGEQNRDTHSQRDSVTIFVLGVVIIVLGGVVIRLGELGGLGLGVGL